MHRATNTNDVNYESLLIRIQFSHHLFYIFVFNFHHSISLEKAFLSIVNIGRSCFITCTNNANDLPSYFAATWSPLIRAKAFQSSPKKKKYTIRSCSKRDCSREIKSVLRLPSIASHSIDRKFVDHILKFASLHIRIEKIT